MPDAQLSRPVPLEHIDADLTIGSHIWMEDLSQEVALGWGGGKVLPQQEFHTEQASGVWGPLWSVGALGQEVRHSQAPHKSQNPVFTVRVGGSAASSRLGILEHRMGLGPQGPQAPRPWTPLVLPPNPGLYPSLGASSLPCESPCHTLFLRGRPSHPLVFLERHLLGSFVGK